LKYTYPEGRLEPGKLLGRILSWSADPDLALRPLVVDCVALTLNIATSYRSSMPDNNLNQDLNESKRIIVSEDTKLLYEGVKVRREIILKIREFIESKFKEYGQ
jgi:hypothetical protein